MSADKSTALAVVAASPVRPGQVWRHVKSGGKYFVVAVGLDEPSLEPVVVYSGRDSVTWVRRLDEFVSRRDGEWRFVNDDDERVMIAAAAYVDRRRPKDG